VARLQTTASAVFGLSTSLPLPLNKCAKEVWRARVARMRLKNSAGYPAAFARRIFNDIALMH
jgi:hypothetical protein